MGLDDIRLADSFRIMRKRRMYIYFGIVLGALYGLFDILNEYMTSLLPGLEPIPEDIGAYIPIITAILVLFVVYFIIVSFFTAALSRYVADHIRSKDENVLSVAAHKILGILVLDFILFLLYIGSFMLLILPAAIFPGLMCLSFPVFLIVIIVLGLRLPFSIYALIVDDLSPIDSLKKSWEITDGRMAETFVLLLIAGLPTLPFFAILMMLTLSTGEHIYASLVLNIFLAMAIVLGNIHITRGYLELSEEKKAISERYMEAGPYDGGSAKEAFAFGISEYELNLLRAAGIHVVPVSFRAEHTRVGDLIAYSGFYAGDSTWYPGKAILFYGMGAPEIARYIDTIRSALGEDVVFGTVNIRNVDMSVGQLLQTLKNEHESRKGLNPPPE